MAFVQCALSNIRYRVFPVLLLLLLLAPTVCQAGSYQQKKDIHDTVLASSRYLPYERPLRDQSDVPHVYAAFELVSIDEINDVMQTFKCNGFLSLSWTDEILQWNSSKYGDEITISPRVTSVFRPLMVMLNTNGDRDLFEDDHAPLTVWDDGDVYWTPGTIFPASCKLDLTQYPFDKQRCEIQMVIMNYLVTELEFVVQDEGFGMTFFTKNGLWDITGHSVTTPNISVRGDTMSSILISFDLKRKPTFLVISILVPIIFLSLLNILVFVIPMESGEKISYSITVLLALTMFMSIMSGMLPSSSESMPLIVFYIFSLLTISVLTVVDCIIIVKLHHMEEEEEEKDSHNDQVIFESVEPNLGLHHISTLDHHSTTQIEEKEIKFKVNKYKLVGQKLNKISLWLFGFIWASITVGYITVAALC